MTESTNAQSNAARDLFDGIDDLASACARYGLTLARASIEACARGLDHVAERLGKISEGLQKRVAPEATAEATPADPAPEGAAPAAPATE